MATPSEIRRTLRGKMVEYDVTIKQAALHANIKPDRAYKVVNGDRPPRGDELVRLVAAIFELGARR